MQKGPKISKSDFERAMRSMKKVRRSKSALAMREQIDAVRSARALNRPLDRSFAVSAAYRLRMEREAAARKAQADARWAREMAQVKLQEDIRDTLLRAARIARSMGLTVRASKGRDGRISSYYVQCGAVRVRISDHEIPWTAVREARAADFGGFNGFPGAQIIITRGRRTEWLSRAIGLALAGRSVA